MHSIAVDLIYIAYQNGMQLIIHTQKQQLKHKIRKDRKKKQKTKKKQTLWHVCHIEPSLRTIISLHRLNSYCFSLSLSFFFLFFPFGLLPFLKLLYAHFLSLIIKIYLNSLFPLLSPSFYSLFFLKERIR